MVDDLKGTVNPSIRDNTQNVAIPSLMDSKFESKFDHICTENYTQTALNETFSGETNLAAKHDWSWFYIFMQLLNSTLIVYIIFDIHDRLSQGMNIAIYDERTKLKCIDLLCNLCCLVFGFMVSSIVYGIPHWNETIVHTNDIQCTTERDIFYDAAIQDETTEIFADCETQTVDLISSYDDTSAVSTCHDGNSSPTGNLNGKNSNSPDVDLMKIDRKLIEVRNCLHDSLPFTSTICRLNQSSASLFKFGLRRMKNVIIHENGLGNSKFSFDHILDGDNTQDDVFSLIMERISMALSGIPFICIAIGSSRSGKT